MSLGQQMIALLFDDLHPVDDMYLIGCQQDAGLDKMRAPITMWRQSLLRGA
jgi:hypothetical protein